MLIALLFSGVETGKMLIIVGVGIMMLGVYYYSRGRNERQMQNLARLLNLNVNSLYDGAFDKRAIKLHGLVQDYYVGVVNTPRYKKPHEVIIRVHLKYNSPCVFKLKLAKGLSGILDSISGIDHVVGIDDFDKKFVLKTKHPDFVHQLFDIHVCSDFADNYESFHFSEIELTDEYLELREPGEIKRPSQSVRLMEIVLFLVHLAEKIDTINKHRKR